MRKKNTEVSGKKSGCLSMTSSVYAATHSFDFKFNDVYTTKDYDEVWAKSDNENAWYITFISVGLK